MKEIDNGLASAMVTEEGLQRAVALKAGHSCQDIVEVRVKATIRMMEQRLATDLSVGELSKSVNVSTTRLQQLFKRELGKSPSRYLTDLRMKCAQDLLQNTFLSVKEVMFRCGIKDPSHFARNFKQRYGVTPSEFRILSGKAEQ